MRDRVNILFSNTIIFAIGNILIKLVMFLLMPLYTSMLTTEQYGVAELINNMIQLLLPIFTISIAEGLFRFCIEEEYDKSVLFTSSVGVLIKGNIVIAFIMILIKIFFGYEYWIIFILLFSTTSFGSFLAQFVRGLGFSKIFAISGIINAITLVLFNVLFLSVFKLNIYGYLISMVLSNIVTCIYLIYVCNIPKYIDKKLKDKVVLKEIVKYSLPNAPNMVSWWITNTSSRYIILYFLGPGVAGVFTAASKLPALVNLMSTVFQQAWQFSASKEYGENDSKLFYTQVFKYYSALITIGSSTLIIFSKLISKFVLIGEFYEGWIYVPWLLTSAMLGCYSTFFGTFYNAAKNNIMAMISTFIGAIIVSVGCCFLVPIIGINGALYSNVFAYLIIVVIRIISMNKLVDIDVNYSSLTLNIVLIFLQCILVANNNLMSNILAYSIVLIILVINREVIKNTMANGIKIFKLAVNRKS